MVRACSKNAVGVFYIFRYLSSNDVIARISLGDLDLLLSGQIVLNVNISETERDSAKMHRTTFIGLDICQRMNKLPDYT